MVCMISSNYTTNKKAIYKILICHLKIELHYCMCYQFYDSIMMYTYNHVYVQDPFNETSAVPEYFPIQLHYASCMSFKPKYAVI